ncbi:hypothetical protein NEIELOOT_02704 [Neisseria elongata subsp. glycolytica ATCC 29315]|uniref:Uncharacterized protein n=1 Tax=Neisseria elongata subsp. glycolytica ATCC 29315 TaxID=546263 RepID=D4DUE4_NEIEG|nr:hypothetical protein NEIELOOT_02704 [Neisseria elongata subsp. glycolytica ATCC 29315]
MFSDGLWRPSEKGKWLIGGIIRDIWRPSEKIFSDGRLFQSRLFERYRRFAQAGNCI